MEPNANDQPGGSASNGGASAGAPAPGLGIASAPPPPPGYPPPSYWPPPAPRHGSVWTRIMAGLVTSVLLGSLLLNLYLAGLVYLSSAETGPSESVYQAGDSSQRIVIVSVQGAITDATVGFIRSAADALRERKPKAVVLRVNSPGGGVGASDRIWHELTKLKKEINVPMVASFGDYAASGGYYVSCMADHIVAEPTTVTGSIGVIAQAFSVDGLLKKVGVEPTVLTAEGSPQKDWANNPFRPWSEQDTKVMQPLLDSFYELFVDRVATGRAAALKPDEVRAAATGRIYTTAEAIKAKLVDEQGYLEDAIAQAKQRAGLPPGAKPHVVVLSPRGSLLRALLGVSGDSRAPVPELDAETVRAWLTDLAQPRLEFRWIPGAGSARPR